MSPQEGGEFVKMLRATFSAIAVTASAHSNQTILAPVEQDMAYTSCAGTARANHSSS